MSAVFVATAIFAGNAMADESSACLGPDAIMDDEGDALMVDILDLLGIEPLDRPPTDTREHILLARQIVIPRNDTTQDDRPEIEFYLLNRREARIVIWILLLLNDPHNPDPAAIYNLSFP